MIFVAMEPAAHMREISNLIAWLENQECQVHFSEGETVILAALPAAKPIEIRDIEMMPGVQHVTQSSQPFKLASREFKVEDTQFSVGDMVIGGDELTIIAGPCSVESRAQIIETAHAVKEGGAHLLRGGAYKPRSSPYAFQGLGEDGLRYLAEAREETGLPIITEVMEPALTPLVCDYADVLQIGARNMQNYALLHAVGESQHPVMLKRGMSSLIDEWLMCAEYIMSHGNQRVMMCERGIRTFETHTRNSFDINAIPVLKLLSHLPVIADPSHGTGKSEYVPAIARAGVAAGADGVIVEVHLDPPNALSDGRQSLKPGQFDELVQELTAIHTLVRSRETALQ